MSRIRFVNRQNLQHVRIVLFQKTAYAFGTPVGRWRADRVRTDTARIQWQRRIQIGQRISAAEFRHLNHLTAIGIRQSQDVLTSNEILNLTDG